MKKKKTNNSYCGEKERAHKDSWSEMKRMHTGDVGGDECNKLCLLKQQSMQLSLITHLKKKARGRLEVICINIHEGGKP